MQKGKPSPVNLILSRSSESAAELLTLAVQQGFTTSKFCLMFSPSVLPENLSLQHHQTARDKAVRTCWLSAGTVILSVRSLTSMLLPKEKGRRCDFCHSLAPEDRGRLQRCTGCALYWYCDSKCTHDPNETLSATDDRSSRSNVALAYPQEVLQESQRVLRIAQVQPT